LVVLWLLALLIRRCCGSALEFLHNMLVYCSLTNFRGMNRVEGPVRHETGESSGTAKDMSEDDYWHLYFSDPSLWWDNRLTKKNPKAPDFKRKSS
jgi:hypothetical protein